MKDSHWRSGWRVCLLLTIVLLTLDALHAADVTVVFRYDDYSARSDTAVERRLFESFGSRNIPLVVGAIPCIGATGRDDGEILPHEKADLLREAVETGTVDVAVHGYSHVKTGWWTELAGLPYEEQLFRLQRGRDLLKEATGVETATCIPPYNAYDRDTLRAMQQVGYACLCAGKIGPEDDGMLRFLPSTCGFGLARKAIELAVRGAHPRIVVILFHAFDLAGSERRDSADFLGWLAFDDFLDWVLRQENVTVRSVSELLDRDTDLSAQRFVANRRLSWVPSFVPGFLVGLLGTETYAYLSTSEVESFRLAKVGLYSLTAGLYAALLGLGIALAVWLRRRRKRPLVVLLRRAAIVLLIAAIVYGCRDLTMGVHFGVIVSVLGGVCLGLCEPGLFSVRRAVRQCGCGRLGSSMSRR